jgi:hypothetical protein
MPAKLQEVKEELRRRRHTTIGEPAEYLRAVVQGHIRYYGVPRNFPALNAFRWALGPTVVALVRPPQSTSPHSVGADDAHFASESPPGSHLSPLSLACSARREGS